MNRGRTVVYFDNSNIFKSQQKSGWRIDAEKLIAKLQEAGPIWQVFFFAAVQDPPRYSQTNFYRMLKDKLRWETVILPLGLKTVECKKCGEKRTTYKEKGVDVALATKMLTHAINKAFDTAILMSGDKDYLETVKTVKNFGLRVEVAAFRQALSHELAAESSVPPLYLDDVRADLELAKPDLEAEKQVAAAEEA